MSSWTELLPALLQGAWVTVQITVVSGACSLVASFLVGFARVAPWWPLRAAARVYCDLFRGTSLLVQLFYFYYVLPLVVPGLGPFTTAVLALTANTAAYGAEIVRSRILAVDPGLREAATALNMSPALTFRRIVVPTALLPMVPLFGNRAIILVKESSLVSLITVADLAFQGQQLFVLTDDAGRVYTLVLLMYFCICFPLSLGVRWLERRIGVRAAGA